MIEFKCTQCGRQLRVKDEAAGKRGKCPQCGTVLHVPSTDTECAHEPVPSEPPHVAQTEGTVSPSIKAGQEHGPVGDREIAGEVAGKPDGNQLDQPIKIAMGTGGVGLLILALSPLFRWVNFGAGGVTGISGDGKIVLGITIVSIILFAVAVFTRKRLAAASLGIGAWGIVSLFWMGGLIWKVGSLLDSPDVKDNLFAAMLATQMSPGAGLYIGLIGGLIVAGALGFLAFRQLQPSGRLRYFYISQSCALVLGVVVAIAVGPERPVTESGESLVADNPASPFSFAEADGFGARELEREVAVNEIEELRRKLAAENRNLLAKFIIEWSRFREADTGFIPVNVIELAVRNDTGRAVSRVYFHAVLLTPGREMPWVDDNFNYEITGGLEPGESDTWNLSPNMFGAWGNAPADRDDLVLIVRPVRLEGASGASLTGERFIQRDVERLRELLESTKYDQALQIRDELAARDEAIRRWRSSAVRAAVESEIKYLRTLQAESKEAKASLDQFVVERARFYFSEDRFSSDPVIDLTIRNDTGQAVSRFYCRGVLSSPGRETPWVDDTFNYTVRGGIQPGETKQFKLAPNMFGSWGQAPKDRQDIVFSVTVYRLDGADETELFPSRFSEEDENRLAALERMIQEQGW